MPCLSEKGKASDDLTHDFSKSDLPLVWITREGICVVGPTANQVLLFAHFRRRRRRRRRRRHSEKEEDRKSVTRTETFFLRGRTNEGRRNERTERETHRAWRAGKFPSAAAAATATAPPPPR